MAKTNRNSTQSYKAQFEDEYEDFGYDVKNARRYQSKSKRTPKFKDYNDYEDTNWSVHYLLTDDQNDVLYVSRQEFFTMWDEIMDMPGEIFDIEDFEVDVKDPCQIALEHDAKLLEIHNAWLTWISLIFSLSKRTMPT